MRRLGWVLGASALLAGCLLNNTSAPTRYFAPGSAAAQGKDHDPVEADRGVPIQLRAVHGTSFLRQNIVWRSSSVEYGQYRERLWSELPSTYVQRALAAALRRTQVLRLTDDAKAPSLKVDVLAFDEVLSPTHTATVSLAASLQTADGTPLLDNIFTVESPIAGDDPATMADAMGLSLDDASAAVAAAVAAAVHAH